MLCSYGLIGGLVNLTDEPSCRQPKCAACTMGFRFLDTSNIPKGNVSRETIGNF